jgi:hypothetical protein
MNFLFQLIGDAVIARYVWRAYKQYSKPQDKMFETATDYSSRKMGAMLLMIVGIIAIILNHTLLNF